MGGEEELTDDQNEANEMVEVTVNGLALDEATKSPVVILCPAESEKILPIWIGSTEAWAIAMEMSGVPSKRPMPHDLIKSIIECLKSKVLRIEIFDLRDQTFYARIILMSNGSTVEIDARPSDSIALALKTKAPIFANSKLFDLQPSHGPEPKGLGPEALKERLKRINPEDFGKYSL